jgi:hypothetical protein
LLPRPPPELLTQAFGGRGDEYGTLADARRLSAYDLRVSFSVAVYWPPNEDRGGAIGEAERCLFTSPVAGDGDMHRLWNMPSIELGLPLLARIYEKGLEAHGEVLQALSQELQSLSAYWIATVPDSETKSITIENRSFEVALLVHLMSRAEAVESAIRLALAIGGYLTIS